MSSPQEIIDSVVDSVLKVESTSSSSDSFIQKAIKQTRTFYNRNKPSQQEIDSIQEQLNIAAQTTAKQISATRANLSNAIEELQLSDNLVEFVDGVYQPIFNYVYPRIQPLLDTISSKENQRKWLNRIVLSIVIFALFVVGLLIYSLFYVIFIPQLETRLI